MHVCDIINCNIIISCFNLSEQEWLCYSLSSVQTVLSARCQLRWCLPFVVPALSSWSRPVVQVTRDGVRGRCREKSGVCMRMDKGGKGHTMAHNVIIVICT